MECASSIWPNSSWSRSDRIPCRTPGEPRPTADPPAASTPTRRVEVAANPAKTPAAFDPPPTHATTTSGRSTPSSRSCCGRLAPDDALELAHHPGERVRPHDRSDAVVRVADAGDPLAQGLVDRVLERAAARRDGDHRRPEQLHAKDVELLAYGVDLAHVDRALKTQAGRRGRGGDAVLAGAGLGDDAALAHATRQQRLADDVVDLVRAGVGQVLALGEDPDPEALRQPLERP